MQKRKSFLMKLLVLLTVVFCTFAIAFGTVGCAAETTIKDAAVNANGELVLTYTDGTTKNLGSVKGDKGDKGDKAGTFEASCANAANHDKLMVVHEARKATCCEEQVLVNTCPECDGYEIIVAGKDETNHGKWVWTANDAGIYSVELVENFTYTHVTEFEELNDSCKPKTCNDCGKVYDAHEMTTEWKDVIENANKCTQEHLQVKYCTVCKAVIGEITKQPALGHKYVMTGEEGYTVGCASFKVILTCEDPSCNASVTGHSIKVDAKKMAEKAADEEHGTVATTCKVAGYDEYSYEYTYTTEKKVGYIKKNEAAAPSAEHTFVSGDLKFLSALNAQHNYGKANGAALSALLENEVIRPVAGKPVKCTDFVTVVGDCAVCAHPITFEITGPHNYLDKDGKEVEVPATCVEDAYLVCQNDGCPYTEKTTLAEGHVWEYKENTFEKATMTVTLECAECKATKSSVAVAFVEEQIAKTCEENTIDVYKTTAKIANGLATTHDNYAEDFVVCDVVRVDDVKRHTITANGVTIENLVLSSDLVNGAPVIVSYNANIAKLMNDTNTGEIRWVNGDAGDCANHKIAVFDCSVCKQPITINLTGAHTEVGDMKTKAATCTKYGYEYKECTVANCLTGGEVVYKYIDAVEHKFVVDATSEAAFMASATKTVGTSTVTFKCADATCNATADFVLKEIKAKVPGDGKCTADKTPYVFEYKYNVVNYSEVEKKDVTEEVTVTETLYNTVGPDSHKLIVGSKTIDGIDNNAHIAKNDTNIRVWWSAFDGDEPLLRWIAGKPADCLTESVAVFDCADCGHPILVNLYGDCDIDMDPAKAQVTEPDCVNEGYTERPCKVCGTLIKDLVTVPATGHDFEWTFSVNPEVIGKGATATYTAGVLNGACKNTANSVACGATGVVDAPATLNSKNEVISAGYVETVVEANCCDAGSVNYKYYFDTDNDGKYEVVKEVTLVIEADGNHDPMDDNGETKAAVYFVSEDGKLLVFQWCYEGEKFVKVAEYTIQKGECPTAAHADDLIEVYQYENGDKLMVCPYCDKVYTYKAK